MHRSAFFCMPSRMRSPSSALSYSASTSSMPSCSTPAEPSEMSSPAYSISTRQRRSMMRAMAISSRLRMIRVTLYMTTKSNSPRLASAIMRWNSARSVLVPVCAKSQYVATTRRSFSAQ